MCFTFDLNVNVQDEEVISGTVGLCTQAKIHVHTEIYKTHYTFVDFYSLSAIDTVAVLFLSFLNFDTVIHALIDINICIVYVYNCHHQRKGMLILQIKSISVTVNFH